MIQELSPMAYLWKLCSSKNSSTRFCILQLPAPLWPLVLWFVLGNCHTTLQPDTTSKEKHVPCGQVNLIPTNEVTVHCTSVCFIQVSLSLSLSLCDDEMSIQLPPVTKKPPVH